MKKGGFRLEYIEIYNWGTFDENIWKLYPKGKNSLLTGSNGSGKTTLVDAIITLLVPPNKRHYNQSSGAESKRERNEKTYVQGAYTRVQSEGGLGAKTKYLRTRDDFSILLGVFFNRTTREYVTLLQVRWFANGDLRKSYWTCPKPLTIEEHLTPLDTSGAWKKTLKKKYKAEEHDSFTKYLQAFSRKFGLKSDKAMTLFAQTVGIKVLGNLNEFIRTNMLEEYDSEAEFVELRSHYEHLLSSFKAIEKAKTQVQLLAPIIENGALFKTQEEEVKTLTTLEANLLPYFAQNRKTLYEEASKSLETDSSKKTNQIAASRNELEQLNNQRTDLQVAISTNKIYERLQNLEKQIQQTEREKTQREQRAKRYNALAEKLELKINPTETNFYRTIEKSRKEIEAATDELQNIREQEVRVQIAQSEEESKLKIFHERLNSLQQRSNRIPLEQIKIRTKLLEKLKLSEKEIPFAAELMKIKESAKDWETVLEQALRPLSICLLIPEKHYEAALVFLFRLKMIGKIRFRVVKDISSTQQTKFAKSSLINKIEIVKNHPSSEWLKDVIAKEFNFECAVGYGKISTMNQILTDKGIIRNGDWHEKDNTIKGSQHILGWDNRSTILEVQREAKTIENEIHNLQNRLDDFERQRKQITKRRDNLNRLIGFEQYEEIDWKLLVKNIKQYETEKSTLLQSSNQLQALETQLQDLKSQIKTEENNRDRLVEQRGNLQSRLENYKQELKEVNEILGNTTVNFSKKDIASLFKLTLKVKH